MPRKSSISLPQLRESLVLRSYCASSWCWYTVLHHGERILQEPSRVSARDGGLHGLAALWYDRPLLGLGTLVADAR